MPSRRRLSRAVAGALAITALAVPPALARPADPLPTGSYSGDGAAAVPSAAPQSGAPVIVRSVDRGFDLGSAAMGAGSAAAVLLLGAAGASAVSHRHRRIGVVR